MKKGQKVRVLADGRVGIVADSHFFNWGGKRMVQYQVKFPNSKGEDPWFPSEKLGSIMEKCKLTIIGEDKKEIIVEAELNHDLKKINVEVAAEFEGKITLPLEMLRYFIVGARRCDASVSVEGHS